MYKINVLWIFLLCLIMSCDKSFTQLSSVDKVINAEVLDDAEVVYQKDESGNIILVGGKLANVVEVVSHDGKPDPNTQPAQAEQQNTQTEQQDTQTGQQDTQTKQQDTQTEQQDTQTKQKNTQTKQKNTQTKQWDTQTKQQDPNSQQQWDTQTEQEDPKYCKGADSQQQQDTQTEQEDPNSLQQSTLTFVEEESEPLIAAQQQQQQVTGNVQVVSGNNQTVRVGETSNLVILRTYPGARMAINVPSGMGYINNMTTPGMSPTRADSSGYVEFTFTPSKTPGSPGPITLTVSIVRSYVAIDAEITFTILHRIFLITIDMSTTSDSGNLPTSTLIAKKCY